MSRVRFLFCLECCRKVVCMFPMCVCNIYYQWSFYVSQRRGAGPGSQVGIEPRSRSTILGPGSEVGIEPRSRSTILGPSTILGAERWLQSLLRFALCSNPFYIFNMPIQLLWHSYSWQSIPLVSCFVQVQFLPMLLGGQLCWETLCFTLSVISII